MKTVKKLSLIILTSLTLGMAYAQKIDSKAKTILDAVSGNYKSKQNTYFKFLYGTGNGKVTKNEVGIFYASQNKYKLKIMGNEQIFDGKKVYSISAEDQEVTIAKPNGNEAAFSPLNYIDAYKTGYNVSYLGKRSGLDLIRLVPIKNNGIHQVLLYVNSAKKQMVKIEQHSSNSDIAVITVSQYKENQSLNPKMFSFDKANYKSYLITEL
ncbi:MAG: outer-membrane lipoprotein carrier protein LolA [Cloacibacterium sp.]|jgi:outer membrane lipoprotein-sorting protein|nr:outer-membrane lipoprotein carrier protein LolA [Cloacibacterium sp.]